jgi:hypothetical protein
MRHVSPTRSPHTRMRSRSWLGIAPVYWRTERTRSSPCTSSCRAKWHWQAQACSHPSPPRRAAAATATSHTTNPSTDSRAVTAISEVAAGQVTAHQRLRRHTLPLVGIQRHQLGPSLPGSAQCATNVMRYQNSLAFSRGGGGCRHYRGAGRDMGGGHGGPNLCNVHDTGQVRRRAPFA